MNEIQSNRSSFPEEIALRISSSLEVRDLCALGCCSRDWRKLCGSDYVWESLVRERWPSLGFSETDVTSEGWRRIYIKQQREMKRRAGTVTRFVSECSASNSLEVGDYLKAIEDLSSMQLWFRDVEMFLFKPHLDVFVNLIGLHYCIRLLKIPNERVVDMLQRSNVSELKVCVKWWRRGRFLQGFNGRDATHSQLVSLLDIATGKEQMVLGVLQRGVFGNILRIQICAGDSISIPSTSYYNLDEILNYDTANSRNSF